MRLYNRFRYLPLGREVVVAVAVPRSNTAVLAVDKEFDFLTAGAGATNFDRLLLSPVDGGRSLVTFELHGPAVGMRHNMNVTGHGPSLKQIVRNQSTARQAPVVVKYIATDPYIQCFDAEGDNVKPMLAVSTSDCQLVSVHECDDTNSRSGFV
jgi:hypothetical protein